MCSTAGQAKLVDLEFISLSSALTQRRTFVKNRSETWFIRPCSDQRSLAESNGHLVQASLQSSFNELKFSFTQKQAKHCSNVCGVKIPSRSQEIPP
eukprot:m.203613 g.203613  ORF g.203613 m.203613 type:complete len:96 (+) comp39627_c1_seq7:137-424(+)